MSTARFKLAVNNAAFPFLYQRAGNSVVQAGLDVAPRTSVGFVGSPERFDYNLIKMLYCENVLPTAEGQLSVSYQQEVPAYIPATTDFDQFITLRDKDERNVIFAPGRGKNYVLADDTLTWSSYNSFAWSSTKKIVSRAYVDGRTFIFYEADRLIEWDPALLVFDTRVLILPVGYTISDIRNVAGASNYLLLATETEVFWSSSLNIFDFADSAIGKAGKQTPIDLKGRITALVPISGGFIIYTERNAVAAFFTNNADLPFTFREVQGSGGVAGYEQVTADANQAEHYTYGSSGLQQLNLQQAIPVHADCADFLSARQYERWNNTTGFVDSVPLVGALEVKLQFLSNRYLVISYGKIDGHFTFALFYDVALRAWGKVRVNHVDVTILPAAVLEEIGFRYFDLASEYGQYELTYEELREQYNGIIPLRNGIAFLQNTGVIELLLADPTSAVGDGLVILGHVALTRNKMVTLQKATFEGAYSVPAPTVRLLGSAPANGVNRTESVILPNVLSTDEYVTCAARKTCSNFDIALQGRFALTTALVEVTSHGSR